MNVVGDSLVADLADIVGADHVLTDPAVMLGFCVDWTGRFTGSATAVVRPASTAEVAGILAVATEHGVSVQVQGGNTGLVGGSIAQGGLLLSTCRLTGISEVDVTARAVTVGAGAPLSTVAAAARRVGLDVGVDLASRDSATIGGMVATNAGGERVIAHGTMRHQVAGIEAVLADGTVISHLSGLVKDNTGYDLAGLLCGSEGTLAVITRVRLRLVPVPAHRALALIAAASIPSALAALDAVRGQLNVAAAEFHLRDGHDLVRDHIGAPDPLPGHSGVFLLVEVAGTRPQLDALSDVLAGLDIADAAVADDSDGMRRLWRYRDAHGEAIAAAGIPVKLDVTVPLPHLDEAVETLPAVIAAADPGARLILFGHIAEGNLHVNVLDVSNEAAVTNAVLALVAGCQGSISAEHGIGRAKAPYLHLSRSPADIAAMSALKGAWDPLWLLGPGVIFPSDR